MNAPRSANVRAAASAACLGGAAAVGTAASSWVAAASLVVGGALTVVAILAPCWTSREARAGRLAGKLVGAGLPARSVAELVDTSLRREAGDEETR